MFIIKEKDADKLFVEIVKRLDKLEVRGDSVEHLYLIRLALKKIIESIEEPKEQKEKEKEV